MRSKTSDCICCDGAHVFNKSVRWDGLLRPIELELYAAGAALPEGTRVRLTLEVLHE